MPRGAWKDIVFKFLHGSLHPLSVPHDLSPPHHNSIRYETWILLLTPPLHKQRIRNKLTSSTGSQEIMVSLNATGPIRVLLSRDPEGGPAASAGVQEGGTSKRDPGEIISIQNIMTQVFS